MLAMWSAWAIASTPEIRSPAKARRRTTRNWPLALTESLTRLADQANPVPDDIWNEAAKHYDETELAALVLAIAGINVWNRLNVAVRQPVGAWKG
jgi:alkylhydroperoxidase family enzyme